ncbi:Imm43 family immunity protein [Vreelandella sp. GE22]
MNPQTLETSVWASYVFTNSQKVFHFDSDDSLIDQESAAKVRTNISKGLYVPSDQLPSKMYCGTKQAPKKLPNVFHGAGYCIVSNKIAKILELFELGRTRLHPVELYHHDQETQIEGKYFCLIFSERKDTFLPEYSPKVDRHPYVEGWTPSPAGIKEAIALSDKALNGLDIWIEDTIWNVFFMSDEIYQSLLKENLANSFDLVRCRVIGEVAV